MGWYPNNDGRDMGPDLDRFITGNYGEDDPRLAETAGYDPGDEEPDDFNERRSA